MRMKNVRNINGRKATFAAAALLSATIMGAPNAHAEPIKLGGRAEAKADASGASAKAETTASQPAAEADVQKPETPSARISLRDDIGTYDLGAVHLLEGSEGKKMRYVPGQTTGDFYQVTLNDTAVRTAELGFGLRFVNDHNNEIFDIGRYNEQGFSPGILYLDLEVGYSHLTTVGYTQHMGVEGNQYVISDTKVARVWDNGHLLTLSPEMAFGIRAFGYANELAFHGSVGIQSSDMSSSVQRSEGVQAESLRSVNDNSFEAVAESYGIELRPRPKQEENSPSPFFSIARIGAVGFGNEPLNIMGYVTGKFRLYTGASTHHNLYFTPNYSYISDQSRVGVEIKPQFEFYRAIEGASAVARYYASPSVRADYNIDRGSALMQVMQEFSLSPSEHFELGGKFGIVFENGGTAELKIPMTLVGGLTAKVEN